MVLYFISYTSHRRSFYSSSKRHDIHEGQTICGVFSETAPLQRSSTPFIVRPYKSAIFNPEVSMHAHYHVRLLDRFCRPLERSLLFCVAVNATCYLQVPLACFIAVVSAASVCTNCVAHVAAYHHTRDLHVASATVCRACGYAKGLLFITNINLSYVGTDTFIKDTPGILQLCQTVTTPTCNKDIGEGNQLRMWSRGPFFIVRCCGHIDQWHPIKCL